MEGSNIEWKGSTRLGRYPVIGLSLAQNFPQPLGRYAAIASIIDRTSSLRLAGVL